MNKRYTKLIMTTRDCMICGTTFVPTRHNHSYCSVDCRIIVKSRDRKKYEAVALEKTHEINMKKYGVPVCPTRDGSGQYTRRIGVVESPLNGVKKREYYKWRREMQEKILNIIEKEEHGISIRDIYEKKLSAFNNEQCLSYTQISHLVESLLDYDIVVRVWVIRDLLLSVQRKQGMWIYMPNNKRIRVGIGFINNHEYNIKKYKYFNELNKKCEHMKPKRKTK